MLIKDKKFYRMFLVLCLPIVLQNVISLSVNLTDNLMLGRYAESALSGVTAVNQIQFIYQNLLIGIGDGLVILASQYWGKKDTQTIRKVASIAMRTALVLMLVLFIVVSLFPEQVVGLFTKDPAIVAEGVKYLNIVRFTYPFFCVTTILLAVLRSTEVVKIAFYLSVSTLCINFCINWCLIYGRFGLPRLGVEGAAIGTLTARIVEFIAILVYIAKKETNLHLKLKDFLHMDHSIMRDYYRISLPILVVAAMWGVNTAMQTAILGHLTSSAIAANSMASNLYLIVKTIAVGASSTANVFIGKAIGQGDMKVVKQYAKTFQVLFVIMGICCGLLLFALTEPVLSLYSFSEESRQLARTFMHILCIVMVGMCYQMPVNSGIIKGGGATKYAMILDMVSIWCIVIPLSFFMAFYMHASPVVVVWCLNLDQLFKAIPAFIMVNYGNWARKLTRE
ncbi:MATE family efflux transporter [Butyricicoccus sp.]|uniref:MATE family efflux transporter n=1 Tax=Butyricicoccus sp. TaxID=2049021 RepID=UPI003F138E4C